MVPFQNIPQTLRVPLFYAEVNNSLANNALPIQRTLILGQKTAQGNARDDAVITIASTGDGTFQAGANSMLAQLLDDYRLNDPSGEVYLGVLHDDGSGVKATGTITFTAQATSAGTYVVYLGGRKYQMGVTPAMSLVQLAGALVAVVNADKRAVVTASTVSGGLVTLTADNAGLVMNDFPIAEYWFGPTAGEVPPPGLATTVVFFSGGTINPSLTGVLANCGDKTFDFIVCPYLDATSLGTLQAFLNDQTGRWSWQYQLYGHVFTANAGTLSGMTTYGNSRNNQHESCLPWHLAASPAWRLAAAFAGACAPSLRLDPAVPLQTLVVRGMLPPKKDQRFQIIDRDQLLHNGMSTFTVDDDGTMRLENVVTTYQTNTFSQPDDSYLEVETMFQIAYGLRALRSVVTSKYSRAKLASEDTPVLPRSGVVKPSMIKSELIAQYRKLCLLGIYQQPEAFKEGLIVEINAQNGNRLDVLYDPVLMGQLRIFALLYQFRKQ